MNNTAENDFYLTLKHALQNAGVGFVPTVMLQSIVKDLKERDWYIHQGEFLNPIEVSWNASYPDTPKYEIWVEPDYEEEELCEYCMSPQSMCDCFGEDYYYEGDEE